MSTNGRARSPQDGVGHVVLVLFVAVLAVLAIVALSDATDHVRTLPPRPVDVSTSTTPPTARPDVPQATLGASVEPASADGGAGVVVVAVQPAGPAAAAGIAAGDVIASIDHATMASAADIDGVLSQHHPNDVVRVSWFDAKRVYRTADIRLSSAPAS